MAPSLDPLEELRLEVEEIAADDTQDAATRTALLIEVRGDLVDLLGMIDTYIGDNQLEQQASTHQEPPGMSEAEIRSAGLVIDVPFDPGGAEPERLRYADLGPDKQWIPPEGWPEE